MQKLKNLRKNHVNLKILKIQLRALLQQSCLLWLTESAKLDPVDNFKLRYGQAQLQLNIINDEMNQL